MDLDEGVEYVDLVSKQDFERDTDGSIIFNPFTKEPLRKSTVTVDDMVEFAFRLVEYIMDFEYAPDEPVASTPENIRHLLKMMGATELELDATGREFIGSDGQIRLRDATRDKTPEQLDQMVKDTPLLRGADIKAGVRVIRENHYLWVMRCSARLAAERNAVQKKNS